MLFLYCITLLYFFRSAGVSKSILSLKNRFMASSTISFLDTPLRLMTRSIDSLLSFFLSSGVVMIFPSLFFGWFMDAKLQNPFQRRKSGSFILQALCNTSCKGTRRPRGSIACFGAGSPGRPACPGHPCTTCGKCRPTPLRRARARICTWLSFSSNV